MKETVIDICLQIIIRNDMIILTESLILLEFAYHFSTKH